MFSAIKPAPATQDKTQIRQALIDYLRMANTLRLAQDRTPVWHALRKQLKAMQVARLTITYQDMLESDRYRPAARFFLDDLYGPRVSTQRDDELARIVPTMTRILPSAALHTIMVAMELDALSEQMDAAVADHIWQDLTPEQQAKISALPTLTAAQYARSYRFASNTTIRDRQIALVHVIGGALDQLVRKPFVAGALQMMETPARLAGLLDLHLFLSHGFHAFKHMQGATWFLQTVTQRESDLNQQLLGGELPADLTQTERNAKR